MSVMTKTPEPKIAGSSKSFNKAEFQKKDPVKDFDVELRLEQPQPHVTHSIVNDEEEEGGVYDLDLFVKEFPEMRAAYGYTAKDANELSLFPGELVTVVGKPDIDWWEGVKENGERGLFPVNRCIFKGYRSEDTHTRIFRHGAAHSGLVTKVMSKRFLMTTLYCIVLGFFVGGISNAIDRLSGSDALGRLHTEPFGRGLNHWPERLAYWVLYTCVLAAAAHLVVKYFCPFSGGSGIPEVKVMLGGTPMPQYTTFRCLVTKVIGLAIAIGSGMFVGKQGPMVHVGLMAAVALMHIPAFRFLKSMPGAVMQLMTAGTSCGITAHFGTPIAGILFTIEITPTYYSTGNYWFATLSSVIAAYTTRFITNCDVDGKGVFDPILSDIIPTTPSSKAHWETILVSVISGVLCAFLATAFSNFTILWFKTKIRYAKNPIYRYPIVPVLIVAFLTGVATSPDVLGNFMAKGTYPTIRELINTNYNDWGVFDHAIPALLVMLVIRFVLTSFSIPLAIPIGLYATNIIIGAVFGRILGELFGSIDAWEIDPGSISMICASAYVGAVTHTFSSAIVILEMTGDLKYCFHSLLATAISLTISRRITNNIFEKIINVRGLPFLFDLRCMDDPVYAADVMSTDFTTIPMTISYKELRALAKKVRTPSKTQVAFFPVVDRNYNDHFVGTVAAAEVLRLYDKLNNVYKAIDNKEERKLFKKNTFQVRYDVAPFTCLDSTSLQDIHRAFITLSLRYIAVTKESKVVGTLTRSNLAAVLKKQHNLY